MVSYFTETNSFAFKELARSCFLMPVLLSAFVWGKRGGIFSSLLAILLCLPFFLSHYKTNGFPPSAAEFFSGFIVLFFLGLFFGILFDADRSAMETLTFFSTLNAESSAEELVKRDKPRAFQRNSENERLFNERTEAIVRKRRLMKEAVDAREHFQEILDALPAGVLLVGEGNEILFSNSTMRRDFTESSKEPSGIAFDDALADISRESQMIRGPVYREHHFTKMKHDALYGVYGLAVSPASGILGNKSTLYVFEDITHRKALLTLQETQALREDFYSGISHDIKSPVSALSGYFAELCVRAKSGEGGGVDSAFSDAALMDGIQDCFRKVERLAGDLLDVARLEEGKMLTLNKSSVNVERTAREVADTLKPFSAAHVFEVIAAGGRGIFLQCDEKRLRQILFNLLENAVKYSPRGGKIMVHVKETKTHIVLCVEDEGIGMPPHELKNIFKKFYRVRDEHTRRIHGTGFGLYLVKSFVEMHGGRIRAESRQGTGSSFYLTFPRG